MPNLRTCPKCGATLLPDAPDGLCPRCLIDGGLATSADGGGAADNPIATGARVHYFGDYELLSEIAHGGMGVVYRARQLSLKRVVALKMILAGRLASEAEVQRFRAEAEAAANLQHPNIVAIHEIGAHDGQQYFSMDYVEGPNLAAVIQGKRLAARRVAELAKAMAEAIQYAHQRGILHRDLKPQNVLVDERDQPRITDFGLAKQITGESGLTRTGAVMGTPSYMSPEQATGRQDLIGPHSDVYALGAILYEMLIGRPPFQAETPVATLRQVVDAPPPRPTKLNEGVPADLETICLKCLEKEPQRRYATARACAEDLGRFLRQEPILARPMSSARRAGHWLREHPWSLAGVAAVLVMGLFCVVFWLWQENRFLHFTAAHPEYVRKTGARKALADGIYPGASIALIVGILLMGRYKKKSRRLTWEQLYDLPLVRSAACGAVSRRLRNACLITAAASLGAGLLLLFALIDAIVWEGVGTYGALVGLEIFFAASMSWFGIVSFWQVAREQTAVAYGLPVKGAQTRFQPRARFTFARLAVALLPGVVGMMALYLVQIDVKSALVEGAGGWLMGVAFGFAMSAPRYRFFAWIMIMSSMVVPNVFMEAFGVGFHLGWPYIAGAFVGYVPTARAFRGIVFGSVDRRNHGRHTS
jgi:predicted Ser/Thr protein kinase